MKLSKTLAFVLVTLISISSIGQIDKAMPISNAKAALIIDSLENRLTSDSESDLGDIYYNLSLYYYQIDPNQASEKALMFIQFSDSLTSSLKKYTVYELLATIHENNGEYDSAYYYLNLQSQILNRVNQEKNDLLKDEYLGDRYDNTEESTILGLSIMSFVVIIIALLLLIALYIYRNGIKKKQTEIETIKNQELESANLKLQKFNDELQQAIMESTYERAIELEKTSNVISELRKTLKKAEEANYLKNAFLGTMSHQIRTPLSGIMGFSNILETELAVMGNEELYEFAKNIQEAGAKLMSLITNIIDISGIEANILELKITPCELNELVATVEKDFLIKAKDKGLIFKTKMGSSLPKVFADSENLIKSLNIVMDNAIQYTSKGFVTLSTTFDKSSNIATIEIKDKGIGIDKETLKLLTDSFDYSKHGSSLTYQGQGLGLILAHRLITLMNGSLDINSKQPGGTSVKINIPCSIGNPGVVSDLKSDKSEQEDSPETSMTSAPVFGKINIFVVEDDRMNRMVIEKMLKNTGEITTTIDGNDALKKLAKADSKNSKFDVMLLDMNLPSPWDGMTLMNEIRKKYPWTNNIPFIAQTAYAMAGDKDKYIDAGFNDYISKPINKNELITMIQKQLDLFKNDI